MVLYVRSTRVRYPEVPLIRTQELLTGRVPFYHLKNDLQVSFAIANGQIPSQFSTVEDASHRFLWSICLQCWRTSASDRPGIIWINNLLWTICFDYN